MFKSRKNVKYNNAWVNLTIAHFGVRKVRAPQGKDAG